MLHIFTEDMQQGEVAAMLKDGKDIVIMLDSHLTADERFQALCQMLVHRHRWLPLSVAV